MSSTLFQLIVQDSVTHSRICKILIDMKIGDVPSEMEGGDVLDASKAIEEHIQVEEQMIKRLESMLTQQIDVQSRELLNYLVADERRDHNLLKKIMEIEIQKQSTY